MNKEKLNIWGRTFEVDIMFDCYEGEEILSTQTEALKQFLTQTNLISSAKSNVEEYCLMHNLAEIGEAKIENIFKYVIPKSLYIQRTTDETHTVGLMCAYKFDIDNGLAVVFKNEQFDKVGTQNIIL